MNKITPFLWLEKNGEEAVNYYFSIFTKSKLVSLSRHGEGGNGAAGEMFVASIELENIPLTILNGGPHYTLTPAFSLSIDCADQAEVDHYWDKLGEGGQPMQCGWLTDRYGVTWQIVPSALPRLLAGKDLEKTKRVMAAMMKMVKLDVALLEAAAEG
ncbi:MAG: VOC family protein [Chitinophagaceae bacterium]|nr:MAG: VOC family protein [Chitinophagaceae bacterium]